LKKIPLGEEGREIDFFCLLVSIPQPPSPRGKFKYLTYSVAFSTAGSSGRRPYYKKQSTNYGL
jgi:hypothetical protein